MAQKSELRVENMKVDSICLQDVLYSFNNSINEEQAWAVCFQCAQYFVKNSTQECFRDMYYYGLNAVRISKDGDLKVEVNFSQGTGKGPPTPSKRSSFSLGKEFKTVITQTDVIQALGTMIYKALDFGLSESEEPHISSDLEALIEHLTEPPVTDDDEGIDIERDSDPDTDQDGQTGKGLSIFQDIIDTCERRLSSSQNAPQHYKAVCRALATEATELVTFLDNIVRGQEKLANSDDLELSVDDLQRSDWARLWVQIMQELRHGVRLKKVEQPHLPPMEFELTPFEILLEDIRLRRYKLNQIMVNGNIPTKVKDDAHAVILNFIRSRPPLKPAKERVLKAKPVKEMDLREKMMHEIRDQTVQLKHVELGKVVVRKPIFDCDNYESYTSEDEIEDIPKPARKLIKPVAAFQVSTDSDDSYYSETDEDVHSRQHSRQQTPVRSMSTSRSQDEISWKRAVTRDLAKQTSIPHRHVARRHTISACDNKNGRKVSSTSQHATLVEEDSHDSDENGGHFDRSHATRQLTKAKLVSYRQKHRDSLHAKRDHSENIPSQSCSNLHVRSSPKSNFTHENDRYVLSHSHDNLIDNGTFSTYGEHLHEKMSSAEHCRMSRSVSTASISDTQRCSSPQQSMLVRSQSPNMFGSRSESPVRLLSRSDTFTCSIPRKARSCARNETHVATRCDSPQTRAMRRMDSFPPRSASPDQNRRSESPRRHSVQVVHGSVNACSDSTQNGNTHHNTQSSKTKHQSENINTHQHVKRSVHHQHDRVLSSHENRRQERPVRRHASVATSACLLKTKHDDRCDSPRSTCSSDSTRSHSSSSSVSTSSRHSKENVWKVKSSVNVNDTREIPAERKKSSVSDLQGSRTVANGDANENSGQDQSKLRRSRTSVVRARSRPEDVVRQLLIKAEEEKHFKFIEKAARNDSEIDNNDAPDSRILRTESYREKPVSAMDMARQRVVMGTRMRSDIRTTTTGKVLATSKGTDTNATSIETNSSDSRNVDESVRARREARLSRQSAIRANKTDELVNSQNNSGENNDTEQIVKPKAVRIRRAGVVSRETGDKTDKNLSSATQEMTSSQDMTSSNDAISRHSFRQVRPIIRSRSEVRRPELKPVKGSHNLPVDLENHDLDDSVDKLVIIPPPEFRDPVDTESSSVKTDNDVDLVSPAGDIGDIPDVIKTSKAEFKVADLLHVSWLRSSSPVSTPSDDSSPDTNSSNPCIDFKIPSSHKWQNPIECLSLTLEEVTHIRSVLTKAELESLVTKPELYQQISKGKVCFTCKKTQFKLFGQWGTKCKFCQRTVCNYCLRKMNVPTEHFEKIPVYTLSPVPLSPEVLDALKVYESTGSVPHSPNLDRKNTSGQPDGKQDVTRDDASTPSADDISNQTTPRRRSLQRSHTIGVGSRPPPNRALLKGPQMSICCDCKSMIMEIIRASRSSVSYLSNKTATPTEDNKNSVPLKSTASSANQPDNASSANQAGNLSSANAAGTRSYNTPVTLRTRRPDGDRPTRPRSMLDNIKSLNLSHRFSSSDA